MCFKIADSQATRAPSQVSPLLTNFLLVRNQSRKVEMAVHSRTAQFGTSLSQSVTRSCSSTFAGPQQWPFFAALSPDSAAIAADYS